MKASLVCITLAVVIAIVSARNNTKWEEYKKKHGKKYHSPQDEETRRKHFEANDNDISIHNAKFEQGQVSYKTSHNHLSDLAPEHKAVLNGAINVPAIPSHETHGISKRSIGTTCYRFSSDTTRPCMYNYTLDASVVRPATIDLRTTGWTEPVRDQGQCGSCWAFSSSSVDSYYQFSKNKTNVVLSPQNLVDCDGTYGSNGCGGGSAPLAFQYFVQQHQNLESSYPYKGVQSACSRPTTTNLYAVNGLVQISMNWPSQATLEQALYKLGAISISVDANGLFNYLSGIFDGSYVDNGVSKTCTTQVNHAVTLVGYGTNYWIIKNSWGPNWGESGYFRMIKSNNNLCGMYSYAYGVY